MTNPSVPPFDSTGYLIVKVSTARGAIPLADATVNVRGGSAENSGVQLSLRTNRDGQTEKIALPTPNPSASATPDSNVVPYSVYNIDVFREGYVPLEFQRVPIFPAVTSIQPAVMIPAPEFFGTTQNHDAATVIPEAPAADL